MVGTAWILGQVAGASAGDGQWIGLRDVLAPFMGIFFVAFFASIFATPVMRALAVRNGIIDWPDLKRKAHIQPVAYLGGVGIFIGWLAGVMACFFLARGRSFPVEIILGAAAITLTGLFDDVFGIRARVKVGGQLFAAAALASVKLQPGGDAIGVQLVQACLQVLKISDVSPTLVYILGTLMVAALVLGGCNAVNLIDGLDGLASGVTGIAVAGFLVIAGLLAVRHVGPGGDVAALWTSDVIRMAVCLALLGAICGFLPYNFNPATIFMGDAGSLLLGFLAVTAIMLFADVGSWEAAVAADPGLGRLSGEALGEARRQVISNPLKILTACLIVFALPITDTSLAIIRRKLRGQPIFAPDAQHLHHLLRKRGLTVRRSVLVMYATGLMFGVLGVSMVAVDLPWRYVLAVFVVIYGFIMVTAFKYGQTLLILDKIKAEEAAAAVEAGTGARGGEPTPGLGGNAGDRGSLTGLASDTPSRAVPIEAPLPDEKHARKPSPPAGGGSDDPPQNPA